MERDLQHDDNLKKKPKEAPKKGNQSNNDDETEKINKFEHYVCAPTLPPLHPPNTQQKNLIRMICFHNAAIRTYYFTFSKDFVRNRERKYRDVFYKLDLDCVILGLLLKKIEAASQLF